jgi:TRAP-type C4-dicarboxylate transport system permease small subunit
MRHLSRFLDLALQAVALTLLLGLTVVILTGVAYRYSGASLIWYDELASLLLAWLTFVGAALAALRNAHLNFATLLLALPPAPRMAVFLLIEAIFVAAFAIVAWAGWRLLGFFGDETLTTLRFFPRAVAQGVLPVCAALTIVARLLTLPERWRETLAAVDPEALEIAHEIARARKEMGLAPEGADR